MSVAAAESAPVDLENCDREPIHIPGHIQPHGALLAFGPEGRLLGYSANAAALLGIAPSLGVPLAELAEPWSAETLAGLTEALEEAGFGEASPTSQEVEVNGHLYDLVVHQHEGRLIAEFEGRSDPSDQVTSYVVKAHRGLGRLKRQPTVESLLDAAVHEVRALTGFDRVMAYRFRHDDSGEVVAEARSEALEPFLGRRYPASDIPAQARRLYTLNTLRLIADVGYTPVPVLMAADAVPLDMSHSVLRSVSPIHVEYLQNMGVCASMSVSIVINGQLWGMLACHHMTPKQVPYSIRMACDVIAQVIAVAVQGLRSREETDYSERSAAVRTQLMESLVQADDLLLALTDRGEEIRALLEADALVLSQGTKVAVCGPLPEELATSIAQALASLPSDDLLLYQERSDWPEALRPLLGKWVGLLGLSFDPVNQGRILALRVEQVETVRWGGKPEKLVKIGPLGARLTPRGSFAEWQETVRDKSTPWQPVILTIARQLLADLRRAVNHRYAEVDRARTQLLAMLGHDLRDPLNSISMAAHVMRANVQQDRMGQRIQNATGRMQRLIGQVLDMSRIRSGLGLEIRAQDVDVIDLIQEMVEEATAAHPGSRYDLNGPQELVLHVDRDRMAQAIGNLLSNARHHGEPGTPILVNVWTYDNAASIEVRNIGAEIPEEIASTLFDPFKRQSVASERNRSGLGLGLYIVKEIVAGHGGTLHYHYSQPHVVFGVDLPLNADLEPPAEGSE